MSGLENGDSLNKCIIPRPHSRVEVVPRSTTKSDKTGTVLKYFIMMFNKSVPNLVVEATYICGAFVPNQGWMNADLDKIHSTSLPVLLPVLCR